MSLPMLRRFNFDTRPDRNALPTADAANILIQRQATRLFDATQELETLHPLINWSIILLLTFLFLQLCKFLISQLAYTIMNQLVNTKSKWTSALAHPLPLTNISSYIIPQRNNETTVIYGLSDIEKIDWVRNNYYSQNLTGVVYMNASLPDIQKAFLKSVHYPIIASFKNSRFYRIVNQFLRIASEYVHKTGNRPTLLVDLPREETMNDSYKRKLREFITYLQVALIAFFTISFFFNVLLKDSGNVRLVWLISDYSTFHLLNKLTPIGPSDVIEHKPSSKDIYSSLQSWADRALYQHQSTRKNYIPSEVESLLGNDDTILSLLGNYIHDPYFDQCKLFYII